MSYKTDAILLFDIQENFESDFEDRIDHLISHINAWLEQNDYGQLSLPPEEASNGNVTADNIWIGSFSGFDIDELVKVVKEQKWRVPTSVQLLLKGEEDEKATVIEIAGK